MVHRLHLNHRLKYLLRDLILYWVLLVLRLLWADIHVSVRYHGWLWLSLQPWIPIGIFEIGRAAWGPVPDGNCCISALCKLRLAPHTSGTLAHLQIPECSGLYDVGLLRASVQRFQSIAVVLTLRAAFRPIPRSLPRLVLRHSCWLANHADNPL